MTTYDYEIAKLRKDAERYRWLLANCVREVSDEDDGTKSIIFHCDFEHYNDVSAAIDAAMTESEP
jgi:hypothetical protein